MLNRIAIALLIAITSAGCAGLPLAEDNPGDEQIWVETPTFSWWARACDIDCDGCARVPSEGPEGRFRVCLLGYQVHLIEATGAEVIVPELTCEVPEDCEQ